MKKQLFFAVVMLTIMSLPADYGVEGSANSMINSSTVESLAPRYRMERSGFGAPTTTEINFERYNMENAPYQRPIKRNYQTYPMYDKSPVRRAAEDVVTGAEAIVEAPLNLIP